MLVLERDLGTSLLFFGLFVAMLYLATERVSWIVIGLGPVRRRRRAWPGAIFDHVGRPCRRVAARRSTPRCTTASSAAATSWSQGLFGMANGGLVGTGWVAAGRTSCPTPRADFIVASLGEELGLTGLFALLLLYMVLVQRGMRTAIGVRDGFGKLLAGGLAFTIALQSFVVVGGVTRVIPLTGLTMPFLAYGGSSLVANWIIVALLLRISDSARRPRPPSRPSRRTPAPRRSCRSAGARPRSARVAAAARTTAAGRRRRDRRSRQGGPT